MNNDEAVTSNLIVLVVSRDKFFFRIMLNIKDEGKDMVRHHYSGYWLLLLFPKFYHVTIG